MKKFILTIFKFFFRLFLIICVAIIIATLLFLIFPEKISTETLKTISPEIYYSVGDIAWRKSGADFYDIKIIIPGVTADFHRVSFKVKKNSYFVIDIAAYDGEVDYTPVKSKIKKEKSKKREPSYFDHNPIKFFVHANNIDFNTSYGASGKINAEFAGFFPNLLLEKFNCKIELSGDEVKFSKKISADDIHAKIDLGLKKTIDFDFIPNDYPLYYLNAFTGGIECKAKSVKADKTTIDNFSFNGKLESGKVAFENINMNIFDGKANAFAEISRRKVKGKNKWKFKYDLEMTVTNVDAMNFCNTFNFKNNKLGGTFSGYIETMVFGKSVKKLAGKFQSDHPGILYFPEAEKYIAGMRESMQKQIFDLMVERLKIYPYNFSVISLKYDLTRRNTEIDFRFSGTDEYKFSVIYNRSWIDAIKLAQMLK